MCRGQTLSDLRGHRQRQYLVDVLFESRADATRTDTYVISQNVGDHTDQSIILSPADPPFSDEIHTEYVVSKSRGESGSLKRGDVESC